MSGDHSAPGLALKRVETMCCQIRTPREHGLLHFCSDLCISCIFCIAWWSSITVITSARGSSFFSLKAKAHEFLKCIDCNYLEFRTQDRTVDISNSLQIFHQNIRGLSSKTLECVNSLETDNINPQILCFSEHHVEEQDLLLFTLAGYILGSNCCFQNLQNGGVCIFVHKDLYFSKIIVTYCQEKYLEICDVELQTKSSKLIILCSYRVHTGDFSQFVKNLDDALKYLYKYKVKLSIFGDINTDYLIESTWKKKRLASLLTTYNLLHTANFATRI